MATQTFSIPITWLDGFEFGTFEETPTTQLPDLDNDFFTEDRSDSSIRRLNFGGANSFLPYNFVLVIDAGNIANESSITFTLAHAGVSVLIHPVTRSNNSVYEFSIPTAVRTDFQTFVDSLSVDFTLTFTLSNDILVDPLVISEEVAAPVARLKLPALKLRAREEVAAPVAVARLKPPPIRAREEIPAPVQRLFLPPVPIRIREEIPAPVVSPIEFVASRKIIIRERIPAPVQRAYLAPPKIKLAPIIIPAPVADLKLSGLIRIRETIPAPVQRGYLAPPKIKLARLTVPAPVASMFLTRPLAIRMATVRVVQISSLRLAPPKIKLARLTVPAPTARARLAPPIIQMRESVPAPRATIRLLGDPTDSQFRIVPDVAITNRQPVLIQLPRVFHETAGGTYHVTGLPDGLVFDSESLQITGMVNVTAGNYPVLLEYRDG